MYGQKVVCHQGAHHSPHYPRPSFSVASFYFHLLCPKETLALILHVSFTFPQIYMLSPLKEYKLLEDKSY